jgi:hypothetical protein
VTSCDDCICNGDCQFLDRREQPYFQAYRFARRIARGAEWRGFDFIIWIGRQWGAWRAANNLTPHEPVSEPERLRFQSWLFQRVGHPAGAPR